MSTSVHSAGKTGPIIAIAAVSTVLKSMPAPSASGCYSVEVAEGAELLISDYVCVNDLQHNYFVIADGLEGECKRWWGYAPHWQIEGTEAGNNPKDEPAPSLAKLTAPAQPAALAQPDAEPQRKRVFIEVPGISRKIEIGEPIYEGSNFTWNEATKAGQRIPSNSGITGNIVSLAKYMDRVRADLGGKPISVNSWYRDPVTNENVGGATYSQHLQGNAIDFSVEGESVVDTFYRLKTFKRGLLSLAVGNGFVHLDLRPGGPARWRYPGGPSVSLW